MSESYSKDYRLIHKNDFKNIFKGSRRTKTSELTYFQKSNESTKSRVGISISRKICNAVFRNRIKRELRESFRKSTYKDIGKDILIIIKKRDALVSNFFQNIPYE